MQRFCCLLLLVGAAMAAPSAGCGQASPYAGLSEQSMQFDGYDRDFYINIPPKYDLSTPLPLLVAFHGWTLSCTDIGLCSDAFCDLGTHANEMGYVFVSMCGYGSSFNAGVCCAPANVLGLDDVGLVRQLVETLSSQLCIDTDKVWAAGFSNGAMFSERLACEASDVFTAVASVAGCVEIGSGGSSGLASCAASYKSNSNAATSVLMVHGTLDPVVPWIGDIFVGYPSVSTNLASWVSLNGCQGQGEQTYSNGDYSNTLYNECSNGQQVELLENSGGGHTWPQHSDFDTTEYLLGFFQRVSGWQPWQS